MITQPKAYGFSHIGHRAENQDRFKIFDGWSVDQSLLAVLTDGVGGESDGALAAQTSVATAEKLWRQRHLYPNAQTLLTDLANLAQNALRAAGKRNGNKPQTTIVACYIQGDTVTSMHLGDSRVMHYSRDRFIKRTRDHSLAEIQWQRGKITEAELHQHPDQTKLTRCLGQTDEPKPEIEQWELKRNNTFVLCSDGFWSLWSPEEIGAFAHNIAASSALKAQMQTAISQRQQHDNATAIVLQVDRSGAGFDNNWSAEELLQLIRHPMILFVGFGLLVFLGLLFLLAPVITEPVRMPTRTQSTTPRIPTPTLAPEEIFSQIPNGNTPAENSLPDFETAMSETEQMLENLDQASWQMATQPTDTETQQGAQTQPFAGGKRSANNTAIYEPVSFPYTNSRAAAKTIRDHLNSIGILSSDDKLRPSAIDTVSTLDSTPVRVEFSHTHKNIEVLNSRLWVDIDNRLMTKIGGRPAQHLKVETPPSLTIEAVTEIATNLGVISPQNNTPPGRLVIFRGKAKDHLGWMLEGRRQTVIIDAHTGSKLFSQRTLSSSN